MIYSCQNCGNGFLSDAEYTRCPQCGLDMYGVPEPKKVRLYGVNDFDCVEICQKSEPLPEIWEFAIMSIDPGVMIVMAESDHEAMAGYNLYCAERIGLDQIEVKTKTGSIVFDGIDCTKVNFFKGVRG